MILKINTWLIQVPPVEQFEGTMDDFQSYISYFNFQKRVIPISYKTSLPIHADLGFLCPLKIISSDHGLWSLSCYVLKNPHRLTMGEML